MLGSRQALPKRIHHYQKLKFYIPVLRELQVSLTFESWLMILEVPGFFKLFLVSIDTIYNRNKRSQNKFVLYHIV